MDLDGTTGDVYLGEIPMIEPEFSSELAVLLSWADERARLSVIRDDGDAVILIEDDGPGPFQQAQQNRAEASIKSGLKQLPREQAEILTKVYIEGKSHQQASDELQLPLGTVKSRVRLALKKLEVLVVR